VTPTDENLNPEGGNPPSAEAAIDSKTGDSEVATCTSSLRERSLFRYLGS